MKQEREMAVLKSEMEVVKNQVSFSYFKFNINYF